MSRAVGEWCRPWAWWMPACRDSFNSSFTSCSSFLWVVLIWLCCEMLGVVTWLSVTFPSMAQSMLHHLAEQECSDIPGPLHDRVTNQLPSLNCYKTV